MIGKSRSSIKLCLVIFGLILQVACGGETESASEFVLVEVGPVSEARGQPVDQYARLVFNRAVDSNSISKSDFGFFDITRLKESEDLVTTIPFRLEVGGNQNTVFLHPEIELEKNATIFVGVLDGFKAHNGDELKEIAGYRFYTVRDDDPPALSAASLPVPTDVLNISDSIVLTYDEDLFDSQREYLSPKVLRETDAENRYFSQAENVETHVSIVGNTVTITPTRALNYDTEYLVSLGVLGPEDKYGNKEWPHYEILKYKTKPYPDAVELPFPIDYHIFNSATNAMVGLNKQQNKLLKISFSEDSAVTTHALPERLSAFCHHEPSNQIIATFKNSDKIRMYDVQTMQETTVVTWAPREFTEYNQDKVFGFGEFDISCTKEEIFVTTYRNSEKPWSVSRISIAAPHTQVIMQDSKDIGDVVELETGDYYITEKSASYGKMVDIRHMRIEGNEFEKIDSWRLYGSTLQSYKYPDLFKVNFDTRHLIISNKVYALDNMPGRLRLFDYKEPVLAYDSVHGRLYTRNGVHNIEGFERVLSSIIPQADLAEFDNQGNLILIDNDAQKLYRIDENVLSTGEFP